MAAKNENLDKSKESELKDRFDKGWKVLREVEESEAATNSKEIQVSCQLMSTMTLTKN